MLHHVGDVDRRRDRCPPPRARDRAACRRGRRTGVRRGPRRRRAARRSASPAPSRGPRRRPSGCRACTDRTPGTSCRRTRARERRPGAESDQRPIACSEFLMAMSRFRRSPADFRPAHRAALQRAGQLLVGHRGERLNGRPDPTPAAAATPDRWRPAPRRSTGRLPDRCRSRRRACRSPARSGAAMAPRSSIVRYEMQRVASSTPGATSACVGHASRHSVHAPHWSNAGASASSGRLQMISPRNDPRAELRTDDAGVLADPADAGVLRVDALLDRAGVHVGARLERLGGRLAHPRDAARPAARGSRRDSRRPTRTGDVRARRVAALGRVRPVGVVVGGGDDDGSRRGQDAADIGAARRRSREIAPSCRHSRDRATRERTAAREIAPPARCRRRRSRARAPWL